MVRSSRRKMLLRAMCGCFCGECMKMCGRATWAVHVVKLRFTDWLFLDLLGMSETGSDLEIA